MESDSYKRALHDAETELLILLAKREGIEKRIRQLQQTLKALAELCNEPLLKPLVSESVAHWLARSTGMTAAVRGAIQDSSEPLSPVEVKDKLAFDGFDLAKYKNPLASIHVILKRLKSKNEVISRTKHGKTVYSWNASQQTDLDGASLPMASIAV